MGGSICAVRRVEHATARTLIRHYGPTVEFSLQMKREKVCLLKAHCIQDIDLIALVACDEPM
jgi:hypothetical protein